MATAPERRDLTVVPDTGTDLFDPDAAIAQIELLLVNTLENCVQIGRLLCELRDRTPHGGWLKYIDRLPFGERKAQNFIQLAEAFAAHPDMSRAIGLSPTNTLLLYRRLPKSQFDALIETGTCKLITMDEAKSSTERQLKETIENLKAHRKHNKKLADLQEENKELAAENAALKGHKLAPTVEHAKQQINAFLDRMDAGIRELTRIEFPDPDDADNLSQVVGIVASNLHGALTRLQHVEASMLQPYMPDA